MSWTWCSAHDVCLPPCGQCMSQVASQPDDATHPAHERVASPLAFGLAQCLLSKSEVRPPFLKEQKQLRTLSFSRVAFTMHGPIVNQTQLLYQHCVIGRRLAETAIISKGKITTGIPTRNFVHPAMRPDTATERQAFASVQASFDIQPHKLLDNAHPFTAQPSTPLLVTAVLIPSIHILHVSEVLNQA